MTESGSSLNSSIMLDLKAMLEKGYETWLQTTSKKGYYLTENIFRIRFDDLTLEPLSVEEFSNFLSVGEPSKNVVVSTDDSKRLAENKPKPSLIPETSLVQLNPKTKLEILTIREILDKLTPDMRGPFPEDKLLARIMDLGFSQAEAQKRVDHFKMKEIISHDDIGNWYFR